MRTTTDLPVRSLVTKTREPKGKLLCAAVRAWVLNRSPLAVRLPWKPGPYQEAAPLWIGFVSSAIAEVAPSAHPRTTVVMARALEALVMLSGLLLLLQRTIHDVALQQKPASIPISQKGYAKRSCVSSAVSPP